jgi:3',5'-nucleoside bisphosphate phosphatase
MATVDLHVHSTASDGAKAPGDLVRIASERGLAALAVSDHDTLDGIPEASTAAMGAGLPFIPAVELSVELVSGGSAHMLGYFPGDSDIPALCSHESPLGKALLRVRDARNRRNPAILEKLSELGFPLEPREVEVLAGGDVVGRPHIAQAMLDRGYVQTPREAFDRFLARGRPAYVERERLSETEAMGLIREQGGRSVLAHPGLLSRSPSELKALIRAMRQRGLAGVEAFYPRHDAEVRSLLCSIAASESMFVTGGTDFHGQGDDSSDLGGVPGQFEVLEQQVAPFLEAMLQREGGRNGKAQ